MGYLEVLADNDPGDRNDPEKQTALHVQLALSLTIGLTSFITFCILRPKWSSLYAARRKQMDINTSPPELPKTLFGWIPALYHVTQDDVLRYAGLDAYVFLNFFRMAIKFLIVTFFFGLVVINPVHLSLGDDTDVNPKFRVTAMPVEYARLNYGANITKSVQPAPYYWMYVVFVYAFSGYAIWLLTSETSKIIWVRQQYLAKQATITDRTLRLSGIPKDLRSEDQIKEIIEGLEIGKVDTVLLCRNWKELDDLVEKRIATLHKLEEAHTVLHERELKAKAKLPQPANEAAIGDDEENNLLNGTAGGNPDMKRPTIRVRQGKFSLRSKEIDAVYYFEEKLRQLDEAILEHRGKEFEPSELAFVTMDSVAACQMAVQAILDPSPRVLLANPSPAPQDVVWRNTYLSPLSRTIRSWSVSIFIMVLTVVWITPVTLLSGLVNLEAISKLWPALGDLLDENEILRQLVTTGLPTAIITILNVSVPYFYEFLSNYQGMVSQSDVDLSVISKNFFFTFFNVFIVFTAGGTVDGLYGEIGRLKDLSQWAQELAKFLQRSTNFYMNLIILQGLGLFPLRLLEFGSVFLYPFGYLGSKTPRDLSELHKAPVFTYGFYLPQSLLIFMICIFYSVFPVGYRVLGFGLLYFIIGYFTYKYQLLYAMDHSQHSTGRAWPMICYRIMVGLLFFQVAMAGFLAFKQAFTRALLIIPVILFTIWFSYYYAQSYEPLTKFIALRGIHQNIRATIGSSAASISDAPDIDIPEDTIEESMERLAKFINPSLHISLDKPWLNHEIEEPDLLPHTPTGSSEPPRPHSNGRLSRTATPSSASTNTNPWADDA